MSDQRIEIPPMANSASCKPFLNSTPIRCAKKIQLVEIAHFQESGSSNFPQREPHFATSETPSATHFSILRAIKRRKISAGEWDRVFKR